MSLSFNQIEFVLQEVKPILLGQKVLDFCEIGSRTFGLHFVENKLLLCFQEPFLRFHLYQRYGREKSTPFTQKIASMIGKKTLTSMELLNEDRILKLVFENTALVAEFFPRKPNLYLIDGSQSIILSLNPTENSMYGAPERPILVRKHPELPLFNSKSLEAFYLEKERDDRLEKRKKILQQQLARQNKKKDALLEKLQACKEWGLVQHEAYMLQANLYRMHKGMESINVSDWENEGKECRISLNPRIEPHEEIAKRFKQGKKLKQGEPYILSLLASVEQEVKRIQDLIENDTAEVPSESPQVIHRAEKKPAPKVYREYVSEAGLLIWVGKRDKDNDTLTFQLARGSDWWLHCRDYPGSHVILRCPKGGELDQESILDAAQLSLYYSKAKGQDVADICLTQRKYVSRMGKEKGKVNISKHKVLRIKAEQKRLDRLLGVDHIFRQPEK